MLRCIVTVLIDDIDICPPHRTCISVMVTVAGSYKEPHFSLSRCHEVLCWPSVLACVRALIACSYKWTAVNFFKISYITAWTVCHWKPVAYFCSTYTQGKEKEINTQRFWWKKLLKCSQLGVLCREPPVLPFRLHFPYNFGCWSVYHVANRARQREAPKHEDLQVIENIWDCMWKQIQRAQSYLNRYCNSVVSNWCQTSLSDFHFWMVL